MTFASSAGAAPSDSAQVDPARQSFTKFGRKWDILLILVLLPAFAAVAHITMMLVVGDWDFWADWKDRQWWPLVTPIVGIIIPAAAQWTLWRIAGVVGGATAACLLLVFSQWLSRYLSFHEFAYFPLGFVAPATLIPLGIMLDAIFLYARSLVITSIVGGLLWGVMFQPANAALFAAVWQPVLYHGELMTVADVMGFEYIRSQAPAYMRIIEEGHLRAFIQQISYITALTAGMACIATYWVGHLVSRFFAILPATIFLKTQSPLLKVLHPGDDPPPGKTPPGPAAATTGNADS